MKPLAAFRAPAQPGHFRGGSGLVNEHQSVRFFAHPELAQDHACRAAGSSQKWQEGIGVALTSILPFQRKDRTITPWDQTGLLVRSEHKDHCQHGDHHQYDREGDLVVFGHQAHLSFRSLKL